MVFDEGSSSFNSTSQTLSVDVNISWNPPVRLNGILQEYFVQCLLEDGSIVVFSENVLSDITFLALSSLSLTPHTTYLVSITSTTGGGSSEANVSVLSPEAG